MNRRRQSCAEALRFVLVGGVATVVHYTIYYILQRVTAANVAYTAGYLLSFVLNFYLTARFTFGTRPSWKRFAGMSGAHAVNYLLHMLLFNLFLWAGVPRVWAQWPVYVVAVPVNFLLVRFVFTDRKKRMS